MSPIRRSPPPSDPPLSDATFDEQSEVRPRIDPAPSANPTEGRWPHTGPSANPTEGRRPHTVPSGSARSSAPDAGASRSLRLERKLRMAAVLLADLAPLDDRGRLLRIAIVRRDEVLLDGILGALQAQRPPTPIGALASQIVRRRDTSSGIRSAYQPEPPPAAAETAAPARPTTVLPPPRRDDDE